MSRAIDLTGQKFGRWTVLGRAPSRCGETYWSCVCDCGAAADVCARNLRKGVTKSCGCLASEVTSKRSYRHGGAPRERRAPEWETWQRMIQRCHNSSSPSFARYGGRGIVVDPRWRDSFPNFRGDMGPRPSAEHSLDRIDNNGPYSPANCRWATRTQQARNKSNNRLVTARGRTATLAEWESVSGVGRRTIAARIDLWGWAAEEAIFTPPMLASGAR